MFIALRLLANPSGNSSRARPPPPSPSPSSSKNHSEIRGSTPQRVRDASGSRRSLPLSSGGSGSKHPCDVSFDPSNHGPGKGSFTCGTNWGEGVFLYWDAADVQLAQEKLRSMISDLDVAKFTDLSDDGFVNMLCRESTRVNTLAEVANKRFEKCRGEVSCLSLALAEANKVKERLEGEPADSIALGKEIMDSLKKEVALGSKSLSTRLGRFTWNV